MGFFIKTMNKYFSPPMQNLLMQYHYILVVKRQRNAALIAINLQTFFIGNYIAKKELQTKNFDKDIRKLYYNIRF